MDSIAMLRHSYWNYVVDALASMPDSEARKLAQQCAECELSYLNWVLVIASVFMIPVFSLALAIGAGGWSWLVFVVAFVGAAWFYAWVRRKFYKRRFLLSCHPEYTNACRLLKEAGRTCPHPVM